MKLSKDYIRRTVCGETLIMPVGEKTKEYNGIFTLTDTGAFIIDALENGADTETAAEKLAAEFEIPEETALADTKDFIEQLKGFGMLTD